MTHPREIPNYPRYRVKVKAGRKSSMTRRGKVDLWGIAIMLAFLGWIYNPALGVSIAIVCGVIAYWWYKKYYIIRVTTLHELMALSPSDFERAVATLLGDLGYRSVRVVGGAGDLARDISCQDAEGRNTMIQCKRYRQGNLVGSPDIQRFIGMLTTEHRADRGIYVTTSGLTGPAESLCRRHSVEMWDGNRLADLLNKARLKQSQQHTELSIAP
jgi:hypothetical protein